MKVDFKGFMEKMEVINHIGFNEGEGLTRLAFSDEDMEAREFVKELCLSLGLEVWEDAIGNIRARKEGTRKNLPAILCGSHIDTVPSGGRYDGVLGSLMAIETVKIIMDNEIVHQHPIEVIVFSSEESSRFKLATFGSKAITGVLDPSKLHEFVDKEGISLYDTLVSRGYKPDEIKDMMLKPGDVKAFVELHIEQGPILEKEDIDIGVVKGIAAPLRFQIKLIGEEAHSGACPMNMRRDALSAAAEIILEVERIGNEESIHQTVATTGICNVFPNVMNVVPGEANLYIDVRGIETESVLRAVGKITEGMIKVCKKREIQFATNVITQDVPVLLDQRLMDLAKKNCKKLNLSYKEISSGAGHDAMNIAKFIPTALIFIPCINGISHNKSENVKMKDVENGLRLFAKMIIDLSQGK